MPGTCNSCLRRSWLLAMLSAPLEYRGRDRTRLIELLALEDEELLQAVGGKRRVQLRARWARFDPEEVQQAADVEAVCRHDRRFPGALRQCTGAPRMLHVAGGSKRLGELVREPVAAIVGSRRATDYGIEMARSLGRGLAASGVTVASVWADGIAVAACAGALEVQGPTLTVMAGGLDVSCPARRRALYERFRAVGCAVAELPCGVRPRRWCEPARERILAGLASLMIVVEADGSPAELASAHMASVMGQTVAAVPGRVTSPVSRGTHELLIGGAHLVRGPQDALDLLYGVGAPTAAGTRTPANKLEPRLRATLERVGAGRDTPAKLTAGGESAGEVLLALSELELMGLLIRGDGGRYVPREALPGSDPAL